MIYAQRYWDLGLMWIAKYFFIEILIFKLIRNKLQLEIKKELI